MAARENPDEEIEESPIDGDGEVEGEAEQEPAPEEELPAVAPKERIRFERDPFLREMGAGAPRRPWSRLKGWFEDRGPGRVSLTVLFIAALLLAVYLGLALGDSIESGGGSRASAGLDALPTTTPGVSEIACGAGVYTIEQGSSYTLSFDSKVLAGYQISNLLIKPVSPNASAQSIEASARPPFAVAVSALVLPESAGRTDEYRLAVTFSKPGDRDVTSECSLLVRPGSPMAAPSQPSPTPSAQATATPTPRSATPTQPAPTAIPPTTAPTVTPTRSATATPTPTRTSTPAP